MEELVGRVARALAVGDVRAPNGRVTEVPDRRVIRWYATIGLVDRPLGVRGRTALYGPRHLLQLVAVKRRQAEGHALADIQAELAGATDGTLERIAALPPEPLEAPELLEALEPPQLLEPGETPAPAADGMRARFWAQAVAPPADVHGPAAADGVLDGGRDGVLHGVRLGSAVLLLPSTPDGDDLVAIRAAARPLLDLLAARGLLLSSEGGSA